MMDLLESCPLYQGIRTAWAYTQAEFTRDRYVDREQPDLVRIPNFKTNLHWSLKYLPYTRSEWAIVTPLDFPLNLPIGPAGNYVWWVEKLFCIDAEGAQKATNRDSWLRRDPNRDRYRPLVADEIHIFLKDTLRGGRWTHGDWAYMAPT